MFRLPLRYALIVTALSLGLVIVLLIMMFDLVNKLISGEPFAVFSWLTSNLVILLILVIAVAAIISAITWGYWLGDLGGRPHREGRDEETKAALVVLERKYANKEITMSEYLALRKGIEKDRPRY